MKHAQIDGHGTPWVERVRLLTKSLVLAIVGVTLVALPANGQGPDARLQILNTGISLGHVNGIIATEGVTPGNIGEIGGGLADATAALGALVTNIASPPYSPDGFVRANRRIAFISENVGAWSQERALREIGQVRSIVLGALRVYLDARRGAVVSRSGGTCDSAIFRVGFHYGTGHTAVQRGNTNLEQRSRSSMRQAIRSGEAAAQSLACDFPGTAFAAVPMMGAPTPGGYDSSLEPLQVATSGGPTPPGPVASVPPPPPPQSLRRGNPELAGEWICDRKCPAGGEGKSAWIEQDGSRLRFTNEGGGTSAGRFEDGGTVVATEWGDLRGEVRDGGSAIRWDNGTVWVRSPRTP